VSKKRRKINMSDTPRTDQESFYADGYCVSSNFARELERENARLRAIFPKILEALRSGACSPECSVEFMEQIPDEVRLVIRGLSLPNTQLSDAQRSE